MKILLLSRYDRRGASSRIRSYQYIPYLKAAGIEIETSYLFDDDYVRSIQKDVSKNVHSIASAYAKRMLQMARAHKDGCTLDRKRTFSLASRLDGRSVVQIENTLRGRL